MKIFLTYLLISLSIILLSCTKKQANNNLISNTEFLDNHSEVGFYRTDTNKDSTFICLYVNNNKNIEVFYSDTLNQLYVGKYKQLGNELRNIKTSLISDSEWSYISIDTTSYQKINIDDKSYLYFSYLLSAQGNAVIERSVYFTLVDIDNLSIYQLGYVGSYSFKCNECIDGEYIITDQLTEHPAILNKLKKLSKNSSYIYQPTDKDANIYYHLNYATKWEQDNNAQNTYGAGHGDSLEQIHSTYYKTNLFELNKGSENEIAENDKYIIKSYFRGNIIGYDKEKNMYFPILIESCTLFCNKRIELSAQNLLHIVYDEANDLNYTVSINSIIFDNRNGD